MIGDGESVRRADREWEVIAAAEATKRALALNPNATVFLSEAQQARLAEIERDAA